MRSTIIQRILNKWPGERLFKEYRFLPMFFALGAALEFSMIHWNVKETNFYKTYQKSEVQRLIKRVLEEIDSEQ